MLVGEVLSEQRNPILTQAINIFKKEYNSVLDVLEQIQEELPDEFLDQIEQSVQNIRDCQNCSEENVFISTQAIPSFLRAVKRGNTQQAIDLLDKHKITFRQWLDSAEGENVIYDIKDQLEKERDPYKYHGVSRSDF